MFECTIPHYNKLWTVTGPPLAAGDIPSPAASGDRLPPWQKCRHRTGDAGPAPASQERGITLFT